MTGPSEILTSTLLLTPMAHSDETIFGKVADTKLERLAGIKLASSRLKSEYTDNGPTRIRTNGNSIRIAQAHAAIVEPSAPAGCRQRIRGGEPGGLRSGPARVW